MKRIIEIFKRRTYATPNGQIKAYFHSEELCELLGAAKDIRVHIQVYAMSNANVRATIKAYECALPDVLPIEAGPGTGLTTSPSPGTASTLGGTPVQINGPFHGRVQLVLEITDSALTNPMTIELEVWATLIMQT